MRPEMAGAILLTVAGCASQAPPPNIVISNVANEAAGLPHAAKFCAQQNRTAVFNTRIGESYQFDCVKRR